uniref:UDP-GlcNAc:betaGal beta-1,3-N-acetylglucosaminyltransferase 5 n=1 Tax=Melanaphis sacchari TaxID=742174 RepID=A0A2H8TWB9_9HEMI
MFTTARRCVSNALSGVSVCGCNRYSPNTVAGCYIRKLTRTANSSGGGFKAAITTALLFIMGALYCLYGTGGNTGSTVAPIAFNQQSLGTSDSIIGANPDAIADVATMTGGNSHPNLDCGGNNGKKRRRKQQKIKSPNGVVTAADMYEPGFRIRNAGLCSTKTRLLVLITSAAAPAHSQNRQAIRMTWMNRYGPSVSMAFLVGTPQMSETDPVARVLEAEEQALKTRLNQHNINNNIKQKEKVNSKPSGAVTSAAADMVVEPLDDVPGRSRFLRDREPNPGEGLDAHAMHGLNEAERAVQRVLGREYGRYGDLIQCQSRDTYTNLTLKSIAALEWTRQYCPWARYLLKTDDDMFIDVRRLLRFINKVEAETVTESSVSGLHPRPLESMHDPYELFTLGADMFESVTTPSFDIELPPTIWGRLAHGWRPIRQHNSKYYVSRTQYTGRVYPDFCTGPAYLMTRSAVSPLYEAALGKDFDMVDDDDEDSNQENKKNMNEENEDQETKTYLGKGCDNGNQTLDVSDDVYISKNTVPYLKLEDVYLTGVVAERLTRRATERQARRELKEKEKNALNRDNHNQKPNDGKVMVNNGHLDNGKNTRLKKTDIIVKVRRIHDDQFANKKITGRALDRAVCNGLSPSDSVGTSGGGGFSWFRWYWGDTALDKDIKKKKKDQGVISLHMVKYYEQFDLWRRLMDGRTKCKS